MRGEGDATGVNVSFDLISYCLKRNKNHLNKNRICKWTKWRVQPLPVRTENWKFLSEVGGGSLRRRNTYKHSVGLGRLVLELGGGGVPNTRNASAVWFLDFGRSIQPEWFELLVFLFCLPGLEWIAISLALFLKLRRPWVKTMGSRVGGVFFLSGQR